MSFFNIREHLRTAVTKIGTPLFRGMSIADQEYLARIFADQGHSGAAPELKLQVYEILTKLRAEHRKPFGFLLVLGWNTKWNEEFMSIPDASQNIFEDHPFYIPKRSVMESVERFGRTVAFDGAILVNKRGKVLTGGAYLENMKPKHVIEEMDVSRYEDLSQAFGFSRKVHTRHLAGIAASYWLKNTLVYVISEEDRTMRIFEKGRIIYSPYKKEIAWNKK